MATKFALCLSVALTSPNRQPVRAVWRSRGGAARLGSARGIWHRLKGIPVFKKWEQLLGAIKEPAYLQWGDLAHEECGMTTKGQHVVPNGGKWSVRRAGASRATSTFSTQGEAIKEARKIARNQGVELYIHGRDGRIRERDSYGEDPRKSKG